MAEIQPVPTAEGDILRAFKIIYGAGQKIER
jgi:hypothetical protein